MFNLGCKFIIIMFTDIFSLYYIIFNCTAVAIVQVGLMPMSVKVNINPQ